MSDERIVDLEVRLAFQDDLIGELNDVLCRQQDQIDRLQKLYRELLDRVAQLSEVREGVTIASQRPPHY